MRRTTFILGAGFSAAAGFPLVRGLIRALLFTSCRLTVTRFTKCFFWLVPLKWTQQVSLPEGINRVDPDSQLGFEELLNELTDRLVKDADPFNPRHLAL